MPTPTTFLTPVGIRAWLRIYWGGTSEYLGPGEAADPCPNEYGRGRQGIHNAQIFLLDSPDPKDWDVGGTAAEYDDSRWPTKCDHCPALAPPPSVTRRCCSDPNCTETRPVVRRQVFRKTLYRAKDGSARSRSELQAGDMYYADWYPCAEGRTCIHGWTNCNGRHLMVVLPDGLCREWDVDSRASNCTKTNDTTHRCWVRTGDPETGKVHVTKGPVGHISSTTCGAGGGSIMVPNYHGFLHHGVLT